MTFDLGTSQGPGSLGGEHESELRCACGDHVRSEVSNHVKGWRMLGQLSSQAGFRARAQERSWIRAAPATQRNRPSQIAVRAGLIRATNS